MLIINKKKIPISLDFLALPATHIPDKNYSNFKLIVLNLISPPLSFCLQEILVGGQYKTLGSVRLPTKYLKCQPDKINNEEKNESMSQWPTPTMYTCTLASGKHKNRF